MAKKPSAIRTIAGFAIFFFTTTIPVLGYILWENTKHLLGQEYSSFLSMSVMFFMVLMVFIAGVVMGLDEFNQ